MSRTQGELTGSQLFLSKRFFYWNPLQHGLVNTMPAKFQIYKDAAGKFRFRLRAQNGEIVAVSEAYEAHANSTKGIKSIQKNCNSGVEDLTVEGERIPNPKYQVLSDEGGKFRFHLKASNGEIIAQSESYESKEGCLNGIEVLRSSCDAEIEDETTAQSASEEAKPKLAPASPNAEKKSSPPVEARDKIVFVGNKMPMDYVLAIITGMSTNNALTLKARGQAITTAVDAAEITRRRFIKDLKISKIAIGTEEMPPREGENKSRMVSTIEIVLTK